jgi:hypothetical protein
MIENNSMIIVSIVRCYENSSKSLRNSSNSLMIENSSNSQLGACSVNLIVFL